MTRLRVGLDIGWLGVKAEGIRHWTLQTYRELARQNPGHHFTLIWPWPHADAEACSLVSGPNVELYVVRPRELWRKVGRRLGVLDDRRRARRLASRLDVVLWDGNAEVCFPWLHAVGGTPLVTVVYDAVPLALPESQPPEWTAPWVRRLERARELGSHWLTISEHAKSDLATRAGLDPARSRVVYPGHNFDGTGAPAPEGPLPADVAGWLGDSPYVLTVGTLEPRKNHVRLFKAFAELNRRPEFARWRLVAVGGRGWLLDGILKEAEATPGVILAGRRPHGELAALYRHASAFAFPSLYEGFGLPVAEAMSFGLPVLTSATTSLPEVAGDAGLLVDPEDEGAITAGLGRLMGDAGLRSELGARARVQAAKFTWEKAARETMHFLEHAAAARGAA